MRFPATYNQMKALRFIRGFQLAKGYSPSLSEIAVGIGLYSKSGAHNLVRQLGERGLAKWTLRKDRSIELLVKPVIPMAPDGAPLFVVPGIGEPG